MNIEERINFYLNEKEDKIDWSKVKESLIEFAKEIHDDVDEKKIKGMLNKIKEMKPNDTEDAIGMAQKMMRNE